MIPVTNINKRPRASAPAGIKILLMLPVMLVFLVFPSCTQPRRTWTPEVDPATLNDTVFLHYLARTPYVTVEEGQRAVLLLVGASDEWPSPEARSEELLRRGAIKESWRLEPDRLLSMGTLAHMMLVLCDVPRGVNDRVGSWVGWCDRRAALQTCTYQALLPYARAHDPVSGGALVTALTRAEEFMSGNDVPTAP